MSARDFDADAPLASRLQVFLAAHWRRAVRVGELQRHPAGMSWITIGFRADVDGQAPQALILRIGSPTGLLAPYRAEPEFRLLRSLAGTPGLPIPAAVAYSDDEAVLGAPFLVVTRVEGDTPQPWKGADVARGDTMNRSLGSDFADALAALHAFDWRATPLADWADGLTPDSAARAQVRRWAAHAGLAGKTDERVPPQMHYAMRWLETNAPSAERLVLVHGDYRVGNFLQKDGRITAILDWELAHLGDLHEDIAWAGLRAFAGGSTRIGGLIDRDTFYAAYRRGCGFDVRPEVVRYYEVLVQFKVAAMFIGATRRVVSGQARDVRMAAMGLQLVPTLLELNRLIDEAS